MKNALLLFLAFVSFQTLGQTEKVTIKQSGFNPEDFMRVTIGNKVVEINNEGETLFEGDIDLSKPTKGMVILKTGRYSAFYLEKGATEVTVYKKGYPASLEVPGSKSHQVYHAVHHAKNKKAFVSNTLKYIDDPIALTVFNSRFKSKKLDRADLEKVYNATAEDLKPYLNNVKAFMNTMDLAKIEVGGQIIDFTAADKDDEYFDTNKYRGKYLLLDFAATGCGPCWAGYPDMVEQASKYENLQVLTYNEDNAIEAWQNIAAQRNVTLDWPVLWKGENKLEVFELYKVEGWPLHYLISPTGEVLESWFGSGGDTLEKKLQKHLND